MLTSITVFNTVDTGNTAIVGSLSWAIEGMNIIENDGITVFRNHALYQGMPGIVTTPVNPLEIRFSVAAFNPGANAVSVQGVLPSFDTGVTIVGFDNSVGNNIIIDATAAPVGIGFRFDTSNALNINISDVIFQNFDVSPIIVSKLETHQSVTIDNVSVASVGGAGIDIRDLPSGSGSVTIKDSAFANNQGGILIADSSPPASPSNVSIRNNVINDSNQFGISIGPNVSNVDIRDGNDIFTNGVPGILLGDNSSSIDIFAGNLITTLNADAIFIDDNVSDVTITGNNTIQAQDGAGIAIRENVTDVEIANNSILAINESPITVSGSNSNRLRFSNNTLINNPAVVAGGIVIPPIDLGDDNLVNLPDPNDADSGANGLMNPPVILTNEISESGSVFTVPIRTSFDQAGTYRFELFRLDFNAGSDTITWVPIGSSTATVGAGLDRATVTASTSNVSLNDLISVVAIGDSGANLDNTSEFAFPSDSTFYSLVDSAPRPSDFQMRSSTWSSQTFFSLNNNILSGSQTLPIPFTGATATDGIDQIDLFFTEPVAISTSDVRVKTSDFITPQLIPNQVIVDPDGDPLTHDYRLVFSNILPSDKYVLEIDSTVTDLGGRMLDGEWNTDYGDFDNYFDDAFSGNGDGSDGGDLKIRFSILYGDADGNGIVDADDKTLGADINASGVADATDQAIIDTIIATGSASYSPQRRLPTTIRSGDYVDNDVVDIADYNFWVSTFGNTVTPGTGADGNGNGSIDAADYSVYRDHLGTASAWSDAAPSGSGTPLVLFGQAPQVSEVTISGSNSTHAAYDFSSHAGSGDQLTTVPVGGADTISITFTEDVFVGSDDLELFGMRTANRPDLVSFTYDQVAMTATWQFQGFVLGDQYLISLSDNVRDIEGDRLDGNWTNPLSMSSVVGVSSTFPSGDGYAGGDFNFVATLLPGDADLNGIVSATDLSTLSLNYGTQFGALFSDADFDGDGDIDLLDFNHLSNNWGVDLTGALELLADMDGDFDVDADDFALLSDLDGDSDVDADDLDLFFAQLGASVSAA